MTASCLGSRICGDAAAAASKLGAPWAVRTKVAGCRACCVRRGRGALAAASDLFSPRRSAAMTLVFSRL
eukprot:352850-Chlamydomonas_euryale.AAC.6